MHIRPDDGLSRTFMQNAEGFLEGAAGICVTDPATALHHLAIAIELGLKSFLLHRGYEDEWLKWHVRHDLELALFHANAHGLPDLPRSMAGFVGRLGLNYQSHDFHDRARFDPTSSLFALAHGHADDLLTSVRWLTGSAHGS